jgi:hypothetical protein
MKGLCAFFLLLLSLVPAAPLARADVSSIYDEDKLAKEKLRLEGVLTKVWKVIENNLTPREKDAFAGLRLEFPLVGANRNPFDYYADSKNRKIYFPMISLILFEDLCVAYAWLWANGQSMETIDEYVTMLKYRTEREFRGQRYPPPLKALRIPDNALANQKVDELSLRFRNSAFAFILAHELGHIYYRHPGYAPGVTRRQARDNEEEADLFGLEIMRRIRTIPMGAALFFQATAYYFPNRGDYPSGVEHLDKFATHPLTAHRLQILAKQLGDTADDFVAHEKDKAARAAGIEAVRFMARKIHDISKILDDRELQLTMAKMVKKIDLSTWPQYRPLRPP